MLFCFNFLLYINYNIRRLKCARGLNKKKLRAGEPLCHGLSSIVLFIFIFKKYF